MKQRIALAILVLIVLAGNRISIAQGNQIVQIDKIFESRSLEGTIRVEHDRSPIPKVKIEDCTRDWKEVITSTVSDNSGRFRLQNSKAGVHYLRLVSLGFNITLVKVKVTSGALYKSLHLEMSIGT